MVWARLNNMGNVNVIPSAKFNDLGELHEAIHKAINETSSKNCLPVAAYIGVLEMVKSDLMKQE